MTTRLSSQTFSEVLKVLRTHHAEAFKISRSDSEKTEAGSRTLFSRLRNQGSTLLRGFSNLESGRKSATEVVKVLGEKIDSEIMFDSIFLKKNGVSDEEIQKNCINAANRIKHKLSSSSTINPFDTLHNLKNEVIEKGLTSGAPDRFANELISQFCSRSLLLSRFPAEAKFTNLLMNHFLGKKQNDPDLCCYAHVDGLNPADPLTLVSIARHSIWVQEKFGLSDEKALEMGIEMEHKAFQDLPVELKYQGVLFVLDERNKQLTDGNGNQGIPVAEESANQKNGDQVSLYENYFTKNPDADAYRQGFNKNNFTGIRSHPAFKHESMKNLKNDDIDKVINKILKKATWLNRLGIPYSFENITKDIFKYAKPLLTNP